MSCGVGHRCSSDPKLLWLWCRLTAVAPIRPLGWEPPYAQGVAQKKKQKKKKESQSQQINGILSLSETGAVKLCENFNMNCDIYIAKCKKQKCGS